jgi:hypothetical protein
VQSEQTTYPYTRVAKARKQYVWMDEEWRSLAPGAKVDQIIERVQKQVLSKPIQLPAYLTGGIQRVTSIQVNADGIKVLKSRKRTNNGRFNDFPRDGEGG